MPTTIWQILQFRHGYIDIVFCDIGSCPRHIEWKMRRCNLIRREAADLDLLLTRANSKVQQPRSQNLPAPLVTLSLGSVKTNFDDHVCDDYLGTYHGSVSYGCKLYGTTMLCLFFGGCCCFVERGTFHDDWSIDVRVEQFA